MFTETSGLPVCRTRSSRALLLALVASFAARAAPPELPLVPKANLALIDSIGRCEASARQTYLYILRLVDPRVMNSPTEWEKAVVGEHWLFLRSLAEAGLIDVIGRTTVAEAEALGIAITRVCSEDEVNRIRANDPTSLAGIHRVEIKPFRVAWPPDLESKVHGENK